ncbi:hypothetical protein GCM10009715_15400 [Paeniglutamicibacter psychrophenolicus]
MALGVNSQRVASSVAVRVDCEAKSSSSTVNRASWARARMACGSLMDTGWGGAGDRPGLLAPGPGEVFWLI